MKPNKKGISMVSLVITIVSIIILASIGVTVGYRFLEESENKKIEALLEVVSDAVYRRQNDKHVDTNLFYEGYPVTANKLEGWTDIPKNKDGDEIDFSKGNWFVLDAASSNGLGVLDTSKYITEDILLAGEDDIVKLILTNYDTGESYLVTTKKNLMSGKIDSSEATTGENPHKHQWVIATCTTASYCSFCNTVRGEALGHLPNIDNATCTADKLCLRCGEILEAKTGHDFTKVTDNSIVYWGEDKDGLYWTADVLKHWKQCKNCGEKKDTESHSKNYIALETTDPNYHKNHYECCFECGWTSAQTSHNIIIENVQNENAHVRKCTMCNYLEKHNDSGWIYNKTHHWKECVNCAPGEKILYGIHVDVDNNHYCDVCNKLIDSTPPYDFDNNTRKVEIIDKTTRSIKVRAYTEDNEDGSGIDRYLFELYSKNNELLKTITITATDGVAAECMFDELNDGTEYSVNVVAYDKNDNHTINNEYSKVTTSTWQLPIIAGETENTSSVTVVNGYVKDSITITPVLTTQAGFPTEVLNNLNIKAGYSKDTTQNIDGKYKDNKSLVVSNEDEVITIEFTDGYNKYEESEKYEYIASIIDKTKPEITIASDGNNETPKASQTAKVTIKDIKSGLINKALPTNKEIKYIWATSKTESSKVYEGTAVISPSNVEDLVKGQTTTLTITTPSDLNIEGKLYLGIMPGVADALGNATTEYIWSEMTFNLDNDIPALINITMTNENNKINSKFVSTGGKTTVYFTSSKALNTPPTVIIGGVNATVTTTNDDGGTNTKWKAEITVVNTIPEGKLSLLITANSIITNTGNTATRNYTEADLVGDAVTYDKTLPTVIYINKK